MSAPATSESQRVFSKLSSLQSTAWLLLLMVACLPVNALRLVDGHSAKPLANQEVKIYVDDGVRCITTPCPTNARMWHGTTDPRGELQLPAVQQGESMRLMVAGYIDVMIEQAEREIRLTRQPPKKKARKLSLRARFLKAGDELELRVTNPGPRSFTLVTPDGGAIARYAEWGGWHLLVKDSDGFFLPQPRPGPFVAASKNDLVTLDPGQSLTARIPIGDWRRVQTSTGRANGPLLGETHGRLRARVRWSKLPAHLVAPNGAPRAVASATSRRMR